MENGTERDKVGNLLIGSYTAKFDGSGRIKIPEKFRAAIETQYGKELFITSLTDEAVQIYPLPEWQKLAGITNMGLLQLKPKLRKFLLRVNRTGMHYEIDSKGRILISQSLREKAKLEDEVTVIGLNSHLEVWNTSLLNDSIEQNPLTEEDFEAISELSPEAKGE
jgi:MraZ protein